MGASLKLGAETKFLKCAGGAGLVSTGRAGAMYCGPTLALNYAGFEAFGGEEAEEVLAAVALD